MPRHVCAAAACRLEEEVPSSSWFSWPPPPQWISPKLTIIRANVLVAFPSLAPSIAALVVVLVVFQIMAVGSRCTRQPSLLQSPWHLMLLSSSYVLPLLLSHPCVILLQP